MSPFFSLVIFLFVFFVLRVNLWHLHAYLQYFTNLEPSYAAVNEVNGSQSLV